MHREKSVHAKALLQFLGEGEALSAVLALKRLAGLAWSEKSADGELDGAPESFLRLLSQRGYFISTPQELAQTLEEIAAVGEGFDLYDLARALADYDRTITECLKLRNHVLFPELQRFGSICPCGKHGKRSP